MSFTFTKAENLIGLSIHYLEVLGFLLLVSVLSKFVWSHLFFSHILLIFIINIIIHLYCNSKYIMMSANHHYLISFYTLFYCIIFGIIHILFSIEKLKFDFDGNKMFTPRALQLGKCVFFVIFQPNKCGYQWTSV